jgi:hypothetical protein
MLLAAVSMFLDLGLVKKFNIEKEVSFLLSLNSFNNLHFLLNIKVIKISCGLGWGILRMEKREKFPMKV